MSIRPPANLLRLNETPILCDDAHTGNPLRKLLQSTLHGKPTEHPDLVSQVIRQTFEHLHHLLRRLNHGPFSVLYHFCDGTLRHITDPETAFEVHEDEARGGVAVFGDQPREIKRRDKRGVGEERDVLGMRAGASAKEREYKVLGGLGYDVVVKVLPASGGFFVRHGQGLFRMSRICMY